MESIEQAVAYALNPTADPGLKQQVRSITAAWHVGGRQDSGARDLEQCETNLSFWFRLVFIVNKSKLLRMAGKSVCSYLCAIPRGELCSRFSKVETTL
jgi:hypothetical protein